MIEITKTSWGTVTLKWQTPLQRDDIKLFQEALAAIPAVETAHVRRYSASLDVAAHLDAYNTGTVAEAARLVAEAFIENEALAVEDGDPRVGEIG